MPVDPRPFMGSGKVWYDSAGLVAVPLFLTAKCFMAPFSSHQLSDCDPILRTKDVLRMLGCSRTCLHNYRKRGDFPQPFTIFPGGRAKGWRRSQVQNFIDSRSLERATSKLVILRGAANEATPVRLMKLGIVSDRYASI